MKLFFTSLMISTFLGFNAAAADVNAICFTAVGATTTFIIKTENSVVDFQIDNYNGGGYAPFWSSLVVPNDLEMLSKKAEIIKKLDKGFKATWNPEQCKWSGEKKFSCVGGAEKINVNGLEVEPWAIYSSVVKDSSFAGDYEYVDMTISFIIENESFNYTMRYQTDVCEVSENKILKKDLKNKLK